MAIAGDGAANKVAVIGQSSYVDVYVAGRFRARFTDANSGNVNTINFDGGAGTDSLSVQNIQPSGSLTIGATAADFTSVESLSLVKSQNVTINANNAFSFGTSSITGTLNVTAAGGLTQTGPVVVGGTTTLTLSTGNITLTNPSNNFSTLDVDADAVAGQNVSLRDVNSLTLAASEVSGNLSVQASLSSSSRGELKQTGPLSVGGSTTLAVGTASTIDLENGSNVFHGALGALSITSAGSATITNNPNLTLGPSTVTGNLTVDATGDNITQTGRVVVGKTAAFSGNSITLDNLANNFNTVRFDANGVNLRDVNSVTLGESSVTGNLLVTTGGAITQTGALNIGGNTTLNAGLANNITLNSPLNYFYGPIAITGRNVSLVNYNGIQFGNSTISGTLSAATIGGYDISQYGGTTLSVAGKATFAAPGANVTLDNGGNQFKEVAVTLADSATLVDSAGGLALGTSRLTGDLDVTTPGPLTQTGALNVAGGYTDVTVTASDVTLANSSNNFGSLSVTGARNVSLADINDLDLGGVGATGSLKVAVRGGLSQSDVLNVGTTTTLSAGRASAIVLDDDNVLSGAVSIVSAGNVTLNNTVGTLFGASNVTGSLTVTSADGITQTPGTAIVVGTTADLAAASAITLNNAGNNFYIAKVTGTAVTLRDVNSILLGDGSSCSSLTVVAGKSIGETGPVSVTAGPTILTAGPRDGITLNDDNDFTGAVSVTAGKNVSITDASAIDFAASTVGGTFDVTAGGAITDSGNLVVTGKTTLTTTDGVTFDNDDNFSEVAVDATGNVMLVDVDALRLGTSAIAGNLEVYAGGPITQSGPLTVGLTATFDAGSNDITLKDDGNDFATVEAIGRNVSLTDQNDLDLGLMSVGGDLKVTTSGDITNSGDVVVASGTTTLDAGAGGNITLDEDDDFEILVIDSANDVEVNDINDLALGASNVSGDLTVTADGDVTQTGALTVGGILDVSASGSITLDDDQNVFYQVNADGENVTLFDSNTLGIDLNDVTAAGNLYVNAAGDIVNSSGTVSAGADSSNTAIFIAEDASATNQYDITLGVGGTSAILARFVMIGNNIEVVNTLNGDDLATVLGDCFASGNFTVTAAGTGDGVKLTNDLDDPPTPPSSFPPGDNAGILNVANGVTTLTADNGDLTLIKAADCVFGAYGGDYDAAIDAGVLVLLAPNGDVGVSG